MSRFLLLATVAGAEQVESEAGIAPDVQWHAGGSLRYEWKQGFKLGQPSAFDPQDYLLSQLRVNFSVHYGEQWKLFLEGQDARMNDAFLGNAVDDKKSANIFADQFDLHQGYLDMNWGG